MMVFYPLYLESLMFSDWPFPLYLIISVSNIFEFIQVFLKDTDERACAYIAGPAPNRWGFTVDGEDLFESISDFSVAPGMVWPHN